MLARGYLQASLIALTCSLACGPLAGCGDDTNTSHIEPDEQTNDALSAPDDDTAPSPDTATDTVEATPAHVLFDLAEQGWAPFPFDLFTRPDDTTATGLRLDLHTHNTLLIDRGLQAGLFEPTALLDILATLDGFSTYAPILIAVSEPLDLGSLPADPAASRNPASSVQLIALDDGGVRLGVTVRHERFAISGRDTFVLVVEPSVPLQPSKRYALLVTTGASSASGLPLEAHADFRAALGLVDPPPDHPALARLAKATTTCAPLLAWLEQDPTLAPEDLAGATVFTTQTATVIALAVQDAVLASEVPLNIDLDADGDTNPDTYTVANLPFVHSTLPDLTGVGTIVRGTYDELEFRDASGDVRLGPDGLTVNEVRAVPFVLVLPADASAAPFPVVVVQHGNGARKEAALFVAGHLARAGFAVVAIDHYNHGELGGLGDFLAVTQPAVARGTFLQTTAHLLRLFQMLQALEVDVLPLGAPDGASDLALPGPLRFIGESLGGITGMSATALTPEVEAVVLNVTGGGIRHLLALIIGIFLPDALERVQTDILLQTVFDRADPISFAAAARGPQATAGGAESILVQAVVGDTLVSNASTHALALALDAPMVCPCPPDHPFSDLHVQQAPLDGLGLTAFADAKHGIFLVDGAAFPDVAEAMRAQATHFLVTHRDAGTAQIVDPATLP